MTDVKPLIFQKDRGVLSQDKLYADLGFRFIIAPNRYRKLVGKTPYTMSNNASMYIRIDQVLKANPDIVDIVELCKIALNIEIVEPVLSSGIRMFGLDCDELKSIQDRAIIMMKNDWPEYTDYVVGYEPHFNLVDEILIWRES